MTVKMIYFLQTSEFSIYAQFNVLNVYLNINIYVIFIYMYMYINALLTHLI